MADRDQWASDLRQELLSSQALFVATRSNKAVLGRGYFLVPGTRQIGKPKVLQIVIWN